MEFVGKDKPIPVVILKDAATILDDKQKVEREGYTVMGGHNISQPGN